MPEFDEIGNIKDPHPGDRFGRLKICLFFQYLRMSGNDIVMAVKTFFHFGESGMSGSFHIGMTKPAVDGLDPGMDPVAEGNGLWGPDPLDRIEEIKIEGHPRQ